MAINRNPDEDRSVIGLDSIYVADVTVDSDSVYTPGTPEKLAPAAELSMKPVTSQETQPLLLGKDQPASGTICVVAPSVLLLKLGPLDSFFHFSVASLQPLLVS